MSMEFLKPLSFAFWGINIPAESKVKPSLLIFQTDHLPPTGLPTIKPFVLLKKIPLMLEPNWRKTTAQFVPPLEVRYIIAVSFLTPAVSAIKELSRFGAIVFIFILFGIPLTPTLINEPPEEVVLRTTPPSPQTHAATTLPPLQLVGKM